LRTEELADLPRAQYETYWSTAEDVLRAGADATGVAWSIPPERVARILVVFISGLTLAWLADRDDDSAARTMDFAADSIAALAEPAQPATASANHTASTHPTATINHTEEHTP
jgi:hypothetical protein